jgi:hypothetical protein
VVPRPKAVNLMSLHFPKVSQALEVEEIEAGCCAAGTSCCQQIKDGTGRKARHPILLLADALSPSCKTV